MRDSGSRPEERRATTGLEACCARAASGHAIAAPPSAVMNSRRPLSSMALPSGGRPSRSPAQVRGRLSRNVHPQKRYTEDQNRIKPDFHDVGTPIPSLLYRLLFHGGISLGCTSQPSIPTPSPSPSTTTPLPPASP